jgi:glycosyltransferase involved in cell wall biosynthesis
MKFAKLIKILIRCLGLILIFQAAWAYELPMVIVIPSYNNEKWVEKNLHSVLHQHYSNYRILYVNDNSNDRTGALIENYLKELNIDYRLFDFDTVCQDINDKVLAFSSQVNQEQHFFTLINNKKRAGALDNLYRMIHSCQDEEVIVSVDGDDWLAHDDVLSVLNETYQSREIWFTHGTLKEYPWGHVAWCEPIPESIIRKNAFREFKCPSHLRTFYAWLFKKIELEDLLYQGEFFSMAWDMAIMYPLAEMAAERHAFINQVLYIYNMSNPINDNRVNAQLQNDLDAWIRKKNRYSRL